MATFKERLTVALWFIKRPSLYPEFGRWLRTRVRAIGIDRADEARMAAELCARHAVSPMTALERITGRTVQPFDELFRPELERATAILEQAPVKLHGAGNLDLVYHLAEFLQATRVVETGVSAGWSSLACLLSLANRPGSKLVSTDMPYPGSSDEASEYVGCVVPDQVRPMWHRIDAPDRTGLPQALTMLPELDMCHYDSDKSYDGRMWAYRLMWSALRPDGILISDDIDDNLGFFHFCGEVECLPIVVKVPATKGSKYIGIIHKSSDATNLDSHRSGWMRSAARV